MSPADLNTTLTHFFLLDILDFGARNVRVPAHINPRLLTGAPDQYIGMLGYDRALSQVQRYNINIKMS